MKDFWGNLLLQNDFINSFCEMNSLDIGESVDLGQGSPDTRGSHSREDSSGLFIKIHECFVIGFRSACEMVTVRTESRTHRVTNSNTNPGREHNPDILERATVREEGEP